MLRNDEVRWWHALPWLGICALVFVFPWVLIVIPVLFIYRLIRYATVGAKSEMEEKERVKQAKEARVSELRDRRRHTVPPHQYL